MIVTDPDWLKIFGTTDSVIEKPPKATRKRKLSRCQREAELIVERPKLLRDECKARQALFEKLTGR
jgi:hypothetical protein